MDVVSRVRVSGPLSGHAAGFAAYLAGAGYRPESAAGQVRMLAHLSRWLEEAQFRRRQANDVLADDRDDRVRADQRRRR